MTRRTGVNGDLEFEGTECVIKLFVVRLDLGRKTRRLWLGMDHVLV